jgi:hypothetical protein
VKEKSDIGIQNEIQENVHNSKKKTRKTRKRKDGNKREVSAGNLCKAFGLFVSLIHTPSHRV